MMSVMFQKKKRNLGRAGAPRFFRTTDRCSLVRVICVMQERVTAFDHVRKVSHVGARYTHKLAMSTERSTWALVVLGELLIYSDPAGKGGGVL